jgi:hypothetical protein
MLDCGATVNLLPFTDASTVNAKLTALRPAEKRLTMYDGTELKTLGMLTATLEHPLSGKRKRMDFYVAATHNRAILGMEACLDMELLSVNEGNICTVRQDQQSSPPPPRAPTPNVVSYGNGETVTKAAPSSIRSTDVRQPLTKEIILEQYADLFTGVGRLTGEVHLEINPTAKPVQMPPRRLPVAIRDSVKHELDAMCKNGIIEPVNEPSPWVSALLVLQK